MIRKLATIISSTYLMALLFLIFACSMAAGTFIENIYNTNTARIIIYNAWWFELILLLFVINFVANISKYKLFRKDKIVILMLHLAFIFIIVGAFITRYFGFEGTVSLREGESKQEIVSDRAYLTAEIETKGSQERTIVTKPLLL
jgi:cytochrome c biogenesis factor